MDKNIFVTKAIFVEKDVIQNNKKRKKSKKIRKNSFFFFEKGISKKQIRKMIKELFFFSDVKINSETFSGKASNKCFLCQKKRSRYLV